MAWKTSGTHGEESWGSADHGHSARIHTHTHSKSQDRGSSLERAPVTREGDCLLRLGPVPERQASGVPPGTEVVTGTVFLHPLLPSLGQHFCSSISRGEPPLPGGHLSSPAPLQASSHSGNSAQLPSHKSRDRASGPRDQSYPSGRARNSPGQPTQPASRGSSRDSALKGRCTRPTPVIAVSGGAGKGKT